MAIDKKIDDMRISITFMHQEIAALKKMVQVLGQVAWIMSDESAKSIIDEDDWDLLYMESAKVINAPKGLETWNPNKPVTGKEKESR